MKYPNPIYLSDSDWKILKQIDEWGEFRCEREALSWLLSQYQLKKLLETKAPWDDNLDEGLWKIAADITQVENEILEEYCYDTKQKKSDVIRSLIRGLKAGERTPVGEFELIDSASVVTVAQRMRTLADDLENQAGDLDKLADELEGV